MLTVGFDSTHNILQAHNSYIYRVITEKSWLSVRAGHAIVLHQNQYNATLNYMTLRLPDERYSLCRSSMR